MGKGPGHFSDIGKKANDILQKDYKYHQKFTVTRYTETGLALTFGVKNGDIFSSILKTQYKYQNGTVDVKLDTNSGISTTITLDQLVPHAKTIFSFRIADETSGKVKLKYRHEYDHVGLSSSIGFTPIPIVKISGTFATGQFLFGGEVAFDAASGTFSKFSAGVGVSEPEFSAALKFADNGDTVKASYMHVVNTVTKTSVAAELSHKFSTDKNTFTVGGCHSLDPLTTLKTCINNHGKLGALIQHKWRCKHLLTLSGEYDTKALENSAKLGLALALKL